MKKKLAFLLALVFMLTLAIGVLPAAGAVPTPPGTYILDQKVQPITQFTYSYDSNIIVVKQGDSAFIWHDGTITVDAATLIQEVANLDGSVKLDSSFVTTATTFWLDSFPGISGPNFHFQVTINTADKTITIYKYEKDSTTEKILEGDGIFVSHIDFITFVAYGSLDVTKDVLTDYAPGTTFDITVTFTGTHLADILLDGSSANDTGIYNLTLSDGQTAHFTQVPAGTTYTVEETGLTGDWSNSNTAGELTGTVIKDVMNTVTVKNTFTQTYGALLVKKSVTNDVGETSPLLSEPFTIKVMLTKGPSGSFDDIQISTADAALITDTTTVGSTRTYTLTLKHGEDVLFDKIPAGFTYTVEEQLTPDQIAAGWSGTGNVANQTIATERRSTVTISNTFTDDEDPVGALTVTKYVESEYGSSTVFDIVVTFYPPTDMDLTGMVVNTSGVTSDPALSITGNVYTLHLKNGESVSFTKIPAGTRYTVSEVDLDTGWVDPYIDIDDYDENSDMHIITVGNEDTAKVYNMYDPHATLTVDKSVSNGSKDEPFTITVVFSGYSDLSSTITNDKGLKGVSDSLIDGPVNTTSINIMPETLTFTFPWTDNNGIVTFSNIPYGTGYTVNETGSMPANWNYVSGNTGTAPILLNSGNTSDDVVISNNYTYNPPPPPPPTYGTLTVDKEVTGTGASATEKFQFTVTFTGSFGSITNNAGLTGENGVYKFNLSANDTPVTFSNILTGVTYNVTENIKDNQVNDGWSLNASTGTSGTIAEAGATALFTNTIGGVAGTSDDGGGVAGETEKLPQTGGISSSTLLGLFGMVLIAAGGTCVVIFRNSRDGKRKNR